MTLQIGQTYFTTFYADEKLHCPVFESVVYLGRDSAESEAGATSLHLFQYASSFHADGNWNEMTDEQRQEFEEPPLISFDDEHLDPVKDADGMIAELREWKSRTK